MNTNANGNRDRLFELMADHATEGLDANELQALDSLLLDHPDVNALGLELAAAAVDLANMREKPTRLPDRLRDRILTDAGRHIGQKNASILIRPADFPRWSEEGRKRQVWLLRSAYFVAAASLLAAVVGWWQVDTLKQSSSQDPSRQYENFVRETADVVHVPWVGQEKEHANVSGEAVWSQRQQKGYLRFVGLTPNNPGREQYQLWIVDPTRDKHPVDGGVFDVSTQGEVIVPIDPKLVVDHPTVFAVTLEKPGGVVVSDGPLLVIGTVPG